MTDELRTLQDINLGADGYDVPDIIDEWVESKEKKEELRKRLHLLFGESRTADCHVRDGKRRIVCTVCYGSDTILEMILKGLKGEKR